VVFTEHQLFETVAVIVDTLQTDKLYYWYNSRNTSSTTAHKSLAIAEMGDRLATIDIGRKLGAVPLFFGGTGPHLTQCRLGRGLPPYQVAS